LTLKPLPSLTPPSSIRRHHAGRLRAGRQFAADRAAGQDGHSYLFFVGRENYPLTWIEGAQYPWGKAQVLSSGSDVVLRWSRRRWRCWGAKLI